MIAQRAGEELEVKYVLDLRDFPGDPVQEVIAHDFEEIVNDEEDSDRCRSNGWY